MLEESFDCVAVPLPESFREQVEQAVVELPRPSIVIQRPNELWKGVGFEAPGETEEDSSPWSVPDGVGLRGSR